MINLILEGDFNQPVDNVNLPNGLKYLAFGNQFNQSLKKAHLPDGLVRLKLGQNFTQSLKNVNFPNSLTKILTTGRQYLDIFDFPEGIVVVKSN